MIKITLKNIRGIKNLVYELPTKSGVYILCGANGCGKTTLLAAINRLCDNMSFSKFFTTRQSFKGYIEYNIDGEIVKYQKGNSRWVPQPRKKHHLIKQTEFKNSLFLTTTGIRLYQQPLEKLTGKHKHDVSKEIKNTLNKVLSTDKFSQLQYLEVTSKKGRQRQLSRKNKLYILKNSSNTTYSEIDFSLGERMLLNSLEYIENIERKSLLVIDEIELALHPIAQSNFHEYLNEKSKEKDLIIIISTHSSTLIKKAQNIQYLENKNGNIEILSNIKPAYILKELSIERDNSPDYIFFVEDGMASLYMEKILTLYRTEICNEDLNIKVKVVPVGGYEQVVTLMTHFYGIQPFSKKNLYSFLDKDVEDIIKKEILTSKKIDLFEKNKDHINYLSITPELDLWNWLKKEYNIFNKKLENAYSGILFSLKNEIDKIDNESTEDNERKRAKTCVKKLYEFLEEKITNFSVYEYHDLLFQSYIEMRKNDANFTNMLKSKLKPIFTKNR